MLHVLHSFGVVQLIAGLPSCPLGHIQIGLCIFTWHVAEDAQTSRNWQGSSQKPMKQASISMQSLSDLQRPGFLGVTGSG